MSFFWWSPPLPPLDPSTNVLGNPFSFAGHLLQPFIGCERPLNVLLRRSASQHLPFLPLPFGVFFGPRFLKSKVILLLALRRGQTYVKSFPCCFRKFDSCIFIFSSFFSISSARWTLQSFVLALILFSLRISVLLY